MKKLIWTSVLAGMMIGLTGCYSPESGANSEVSRSELRRFIDRQVATEKKYLFLAEKMALLLEEAAAMPNDEAAMDHLRKFYADNKTELKLVEREFDGWQRNVGHDELIEFVMTLEEQPYATKLQRLVPAFRSRINYNKDWLYEYEVLVGILAIKR